MLYCTVLPHLYCAADMRPALPADTYSQLAAAYFHSAMLLAVCLSTHQLFLDMVFSAFTTVALLYLGGSSLLSGAVSVGSVYAMLRYVAVVQQGYVALSEGVARFFASYGTLSACPEVLATAPMAEAVETTPCGCPLTFPYPPFHSTFPSLPCLAAGSLEHVIDLHHRGQLTNRGKSAVLEYLEREDAACGSLASAPRAAEGSVDAVAAAESGWANWTRRLTAADWVGGIRCRDLVYNYK